MSLEPDIISNEILSSEQSEKIIKNKRDLIQKYVPDIDDGDIDQVMRNITEIKTEKLQDEAEKDNENEYNVKEMIKKLELYLSKDELTSSHIDLLKNYLQVLDFNNIATINQITSKIILSIEQKLIALESGETRLDEAEAAVLAAWLLALVPRPPAPPARAPAPALRLLLPRLPERAQLCVARAYWRAGAGARTLLALADAAAPPAPLAALLLRAAAQRLLLSAVEPMWELGALTANHLGQRVTSLRGRREQALLLRVAARVLAADPSGALVEALSELFQESDHALRLEVMKLEVLYGVQM